LQKIRLPIGWHTLFDEKIMLLFFGLDCGMLDSLLTSCNPKTIDVSPAFLENGSAEKIPV
jgi:hypothetical protein